METFIPKMIRYVTLLIFAITILVATISIGIFALSSKMVSTESLTESVWNSKFWSELPQTIIGGFIGLGTALLIYYRQNKKDQAKELQSQRDELNDTLVYFKELLQGIVSTIDQQNKQALKFSEAVKKNPYELQDLMHVASKDIDRVHAMDSFQIFHAFRHKFSHQELWIKDFRRMYSDLDFIHAAFKSMVKIYQVYKDGLYKRQLEVKNIVEGLSDHLAKTLLEFKRSPEYKEDEKFKFVNGWLLNFHVLIEEKIQISDYDSKFLDPLLKEVMKKYDGEPWAVTISFSCKKARLLLTDNKLDADESAESIGESAAQLQISKEGLELVISKIQ